MNEVVTSTKAALVTATVAIAAIAVPILTILIA